MIVDPSSLQLSTQNQTNSDHGQPIIYDEPLFSPQFVAWTLLCLGCLLVVFANFWGYILTPQYISYGSYNWSPQAVERMALNIRCFGFLLFGFGLAQRIIIQIKESGR